MSNGSMETREPPRGLFAILARVGPGLIVAGSIVGSGELIATTKVGAESGFLLLWLILIGCVIKVFTQVELGRATLTEGRTTLETLDALPGPRARAGWAVWLWLIMTLLTLAQQGGILGGVGQALALTQPLTAHGSEFNALQDELVGLEVERAIAQNTGGAASGGEYDGRIVELRAAVEEHGAPRDAYLWATILAVPTAIVLVFGRYGLMQLVATALVMSFTIMTVITVVLLQLNPDWAIRPSEIALGLRFSLPQAAPGASGPGPMATALAAFGIIGVGAAELVMYPYWCLEKGYARWTGAREDSGAWRERARGWMRVLRLDAFLSAAIYTFATVAFYLLGAAVLGRAGLNPERDSMVRTLAEMYAPVFGEWAPGLFLVGAFAVLYSTFFVASAGIARIAADAVLVFGVRPNRPGERERWTRIFSGLFPLLSLGVFCFVQAPAQLVLAGGIAQAGMLPALGFAALWVRYKRTDAGLRPGRLWDLCLWLSFFSFCVVGAWALASRLFPARFG